MSVATRHRSALTVLALALMAGGALLVAWWAGWRAVADAVQAIQPGWIALLVVAVPVALAGYVISYRAFARLDGGPNVGWPTAARTVLAGFGPFTIAGGLAVDRRAMAGLGASEEEARRFVLGLGSLEYGVLAPAACACAIIELVAGGRGIQGAVLWSWALAVPVGFAIGLWAAAPERRERIEPRTRARCWLRSSLEGVGMLRAIILTPVRHAGAWVGMTLHWASEIAALYCALRLFGIEFSAARVVLAYATGYALTRRTMPLAGAGATQILMSLAILWVGAPLAAALPAVVAYRLATLLLPAPLAARSHERLEPVLRAADR